MRVAMGRTNFATLMLYAGLASAFAAYSGGAPLQKPMPMAFPLPPPLAPQPLCASQFALVNHACSMIMPAPAPPPAPPLPPLSPPGLAPPPPCHDDDESQVENHHHHHHCHGYRHHHGHHHRRRHGRREREPSPAEQDCCKWLKEVDSECVCDLLVRLPSFLARPIHEYTVIVADTCNVTYSCGGRLHP